MTFSPMDEKELLMWENVNADEYVRSSEAQDRITQENRLRETHDKVETIARKVDEMSESNFLLNSNASCRLPTAIEERFSYLEDQMRRTSMALDWIVASLSHNGRHATDPPALLDIDEQRAREKKKREDEARQKKNEIRLKLTAELELHTLTRQPAYPTSCGIEILRFPVPNDRVPFEVEFPDYKPPSYTDQTVLQSAYSDVDLLKEGSGTELPFNKLDTELNVDRKSFVKTYGVNSMGVPLNPKGRTGLRGRGVLPRWGPNHVGNAIITRWMMSAEQTEVVIKRGKRALQFLAVLRKDNSEWAIPEIIFPDADCPVYRCVANLFSGESKSKLENLRGQQREVYTGYLDDPRNTDNAWIETIVMNYHDKDGSFLDNFTPKGDDSVKAVKWLPVKSDLTLYGSHIDRLYDVAEIHKASF